MPLVDAKLSLQCQRFFEQTLGLVEQEAISQIDSEVAPKAEVARGIDALVSPQHLRKRPRTLEVSLCLVQAPEMRQRCGPPPERQERFAVTRVNPIVARRALVRMIWAGYPPSVDCVDRLPQYDACQPIGAFFFVKLDAQSHAGLDIDWYVAGRCGLLMQ